MKKIFFLLCILFPFLSSCEDQLGGQTDPKLNISEYTFSKEGGHLEVYSTLDYHLAILRPYECEDSTVVSGEKYGVPFVKSIFNRQTDIRTFAFFHFLHFELGAGKTFLILDCVKRCFLSSIFHFQLKTCTWSKIMNCFG